MPTCIHCNRPFLNKEALHQHLASSGSQHPFCQKCDRRFISEIALESHIAAKHPPSYDCELCQRSFTTSFALDDHYRGSPAHPNCIRCGKGFKDVNERDDHRKTSHRVITCSLCDGVFVDEDALEDHYKESDNHPSCTNCGWSFKNSTTYNDHVSLFHPELQCTTCKENFKTIDDVHVHYANSVKHKKCEKCGRGCKDDVEHLHHVQENHTNLTPSPKSSNTWDNYRNSVDIYHRDFPPPSQVIDRAWISTESSPLRSSFTSSYTPRHTTNTLISGQIMYSSSETPVLPNTNTRPHASVPNARRTSKQWPTQHSFETQGFIPPQVSTQPRKGIRVGSSQQLIPPASQQDTWRSTKSEAGKNDNSGSRAGRTDSTGVSFNPFGPLPKL